MDRRRAICALGSAVTLPMLGGAVWDPGAVGVLRSARRSLSTSTYRFQTLTRHQHASVATLAELIIPETSTPGATSAGVDEFVDLILTEWFDSVETARFLNGLSALDADAMASQGVDFVDLGREQQVVMLEALDAELQQLLEASPDAAGSLDPVAAPTEAASEGPDPSEHFFYQMKRLTLTGYFTSEAGMKQELEYQIIPGRYDGCADRG